MRRSQENPDRIRPASREDETVEIGGLTFYGVEWCSDFRGDSLNPYFFNDCEWLV